MRLLHLIVIAALVSAAVYVYKIKFDSTLQAERVANLNADLHKVHDATAALRAEAAQLESPARIQGLAQRHLKLQPVDASQFDSLDRLPDRPTPLVPPDVQDPIAAMIDMRAPDYPTGSIKPPAPSAPPAAR
jgi:cell division protein FtsL